MEAFIFVERSGRPDQTESKAERQRIRRHAMRGVATARRERGGYGQHNRRQFSVFIERTNIQETNAASSYEPSISTLKVDIRMLSCPSAHGYEAARTRHGFDILSLSALTSVYLSRYSVTILCSNPQQMQRLVGL